MTENAGATASSTPSTTPSTTSTSTSTFAPVSVELRRMPPLRPLSNLLVLVAFGVLPSTALPLLYFLASGDLSIDVAGALAVVTVGATIAFLAYHLALPKPGPVVIDAAHLSFPLARRGVVQVALPALLVCRADKKNLIVVEKTRAWALPRGVFASAGGADAVVDAVRAALAVHEHGAAYLDRLDENARRQQAFQARRPWLTYGVLGVCVALFVVEVAVGALEPGHDVRLLALGANAGSLVARGEVWRLVTACLLHGSLIHLALNLSGLWSTGALLERWLGRSSYAIVLFVTGGLGHGASALVGHAFMSVGISGALFGLLGVLLWSTLRFRKSASGPRIPFGGWIFLLASNGFLAAIPFVDVTAHVAGFVAGFVTAIVVAPRDGAAPPSTARTRFALACAFGALTVLSLCCAAMNALGAFGFLAHSPSVN